MDIKRYSESYNGSILYDQHLNYPYSEGIQRGPIHFKSLTNLKTHFYP